MFLLAHAFDERRLKNCSRFVATLRLGEHCYSNESCFPIDETVPSGGVVNVVG